MPTPFAPASARPALPSQLQLFYAAHRQVAETNKLFLELVDQGMTREDLQGCLKLRPALWGRFEGFLDKLPSRHSASASASTPVN